MPRRAKGPRLYLDPGERVWVIRDGARKRRTGCGEDERRDAEKQLAAYIAEKYRPVSDRRPDRVLVADALTFYLRESAPGHRAADTTADCVDRLLDWWQGRALSDVRASTCRDYVGDRTKQGWGQAKRGAALKKRVSAETARRELGVLRAAINAYHAEHNLEAVPVVTMPPASEPRPRWLTRGEAAAMLRAARRHPERPARQATIRFILLGLYTGTRSGPLRSLGWMPHVGGGHVDLEHGVIHRRGQGRSDTTKQRPPMRIPARLVGHLRRWRKIDAAAKRREGAPPILAVIHDESGRAIREQRKSWSWVRERAGLGADAVPHILRHTAVTWAMQQGADLWEAAGFFGMSPEILWRVYGHHHPDFQRALADKIGRTRR